MIHMHYLFVLLNITCGELGTSYLVCPHISNHRVLRASRNSRMARRR